MVSAEESGVTEQTIRADLRKEEVDAVAENRGVMKDCSPLSVVLQGLHLEHTQCVFLLSHHYHAEIKPFS